MTMCAVKLTARPAICTRISGVVVPGYDTELTNRVVALAQDLLEFNGTLRTDE